MIKELKDIETRLMSVVIPPGKSDLHNELITIFIDMRKSFEEMLENAENSNITGVEKSADKNQMINLKLTDYTEKYLKSEI
ncbi:MAG: hypothetical protein GY795_32635 [Desulfobacterales bacterium]|nr:hypothetical protein [Desulfobacterales bacterium]